MADSMQSPCRGNQALPMSPLITDWDLLVMVGARDLDLHGMAKWRKRITRRPVAVRTPPLGPARSRGGIRAGVTTSRRSGRCHAHDIIGVHRRRENGAIPISG